MGGTFQWLTSIIYLPDTPRTMQNILTWHRSFRKNKKQKTSEKICSVTLETICNNPLVLLTSRVDHLLVESKKKASQQHEALWGGFSIRKQSENNLQGQNVPTALLRAMPF